MANKLRSAQSTQGRRMAGARALWRANGMKDEQIGKPVIAVVNSFTQFVLEMQNEETKKYFEHKNLFHLFY